MAQVSNVGDSRGEAGVRVLVALAPRSYREVVALYVHQHRPQAEVLMVVPDALDAETQRFEPHLVLCNGITEGVRGSVLSWIEIKLENGMDANLSVGNRNLHKIEDIGMEDLLRILDETAELIPRA
jgi:hypothetical protein